jgi:hypothetical protein
LVASRVPGVDVHDVIQAHRRHIVESMQQWTRVKRETDPTEVSPALILDAELFRLDAVVRWLDAADTRMRRAGIVPRSALATAPSPASASAAPPPSPDRAVEVPR